MRTTKILALFFISFLLPLFCPNVGQTQSSERDQFRQALVDQEAGLQETAHKLFETVAAGQGRLSDYAHWYLAQMDIAKNDTASAQKNLSVLSIGKSSSRLFLLAQLQRAQLFRKDENYKKARELVLPLEKKNRRDEVYPEILQILAESEAHLKNQSMACKWGKKLFTKFPDKDYTLPSVCAVQLSDERERIRNLQFSALLEKAKSEIQTLLTGTAVQKEKGLKLQSALLMREGDIDQLLQTLGPRYESDQNDIEFLSLLANALARSGDMEASVGLNYRIYRLSPRSKVGRKALYQAAFLSYQFQDYDGASRRFQEFIKAFSSSGLTRDARWHLAWIRYLRGDYGDAQKALALLKSHSRKGAEQEKLSYWHAMCLLKQGMYAEAREEFRPLASGLGISFYNFAAKARLAKIEEFLPRKISESVKFSRLPVVEVPRANLAEDMVDVLQVPVVVEVAEAPATTQVLTDQDSEESLESDSAEEDSIDNSSEESKVATLITGKALTERLALVDDLLMLNLRDWARWELFEIEKRTRGKEALRSLIEKYEQVGSYNRSSALALGQISAEKKSAVDENSEAWHHAYPRAFSEEVDRFGAQFSVPTEFVWGIMRTESQYKKDVVSPVGARGLMQVMPFTAVKVAAWLGDKKFEPQQLNLPNKNVQIGVKYLSHLQKKFSGNWALTAAAYNAGPHRVWNWLGGFSQLDLDEFIEHIPFLETRNYVKRVLSTAYIYSRVYGSLNKAKDLKSVDPKPYLHLAAPLAVERTTPALAQELWKENWDEQ
jgi:soluble lytic murein transglycosylase